MMNGPDSAIQGVQLCSISLDPWRHCCLTYWQVTRARATPQLLTGCCTTVVFDAQLLLADIQLATLPRPSL
jgi:hypothetical protein